MRDIGSYGAGERDAALAEGIVEGVVRCLKRSSGQVVPGDNDTSVDAPRIVGVGPNRRGGFDVSAARARDRDDNGVAPLLAGVREPNRVVASVPRWRQSIGTGSVGTQSKRCCSVGEFFRDGDSDERIFEADRLAITSRAPRRRDENQTSEPGHRGWGTTTKPSTAIPLTGTVREPGRTQVRIVHDLLQTVQQPIGRYALSVSPPPPTPDSPNNGDEGEQRDPNQRWPEPCRAFGRYTEHVLHDA